MADQGRWVNPTTAHTQAFRTHASPVVRHIVNRPYQAGPAVGASFVGSTIRLPSSARARSNGAFEAILSENALLANQLLETRRELRDASAAAAQLASTAAATASERRADADRAAQSLSPDAFASWLSAAGGAGRDRVRASFGAPSLSSDAFVGWLTAVSRAEEGGATESVGMAPSGGLSGLAPARSATVHGLQGGVGGVHHYYGPVHYHIHTAASDFQLASSSLLALGDARTSLRPPAGPQSATAAAAAKDTSMAAGLGARTLSVGPISCTHLHNRDAKGRSDPFVRVRLRSDARVCVESARKDNTLSPRWANSLTLQLPAAAARTAAAADEHAMTKEEKEGAEAEEDDVLVEVWDFDRKGPEPLGHALLRLRTQPAGENVTLKLSGSHAEVGKGQPPTITLSWRLAEPPRVSEVPAGDALAGGPSAAAAAVVAAAARRIAALGESTAVGPIPSVGYDRGSTPPGHGLVRVVTVGPISCAHLKNRDAKGASDPFVRVRAAFQAPPSQQRGTPSRVLVAETEPKQNELNPQWPDARLELRWPATDGQAAEVLLVEVWDHDRDGSEALGYIELPIGTRPRGERVWFKLRGNEQEVLRDRSAITLSWRCEDVLAPRTPPQLEGRLGVEPPAGPPQQQHATHSTERSPAAALARGRRLPPPPRPPSIGSTVSARR
jgi:hypothetical protein